MSRVQLAGETQVPIRHSREGFSISKMLETAASTSIDSTAGRRR
jgi:hypothetical protein